MILPIFESKEIGLFISIINCYLAALLWVIIEGTASPEVNYFVWHFGPKGHQEPRNEVESLTLPKKLLGLNQEPYDSDYNTLAS